MTDRPQPWQVAADLEAAAMAVRKAQISIAAVHKSAWDEMGGITGIWNFDADAGDIANALQALSDKYQAIADAKPEPGSDEWLKQSPQFHPGDLA